MHCGSYGDVTTILSRKSELVMITCSSKKTVKTHSEKSSVTKVLVRCIRSVFLINFFNVDSNFVKSLMTQNHAPRFDGRGENMKFSKITYFQDHF